MAGMFFCVGLFFLYGPFSIKNPFTVFYFNATSSLPRGFYLRLPGEQTYKDGDYVVYEPTPSVKAIALQRQWLNDDEFLLKKIGAMPHETYSINEDNLQFYANGTYVGQVYLTDRTNLPMPVIRGEHEVPENEFLPIADHPRSFDGRYTGPVPFTNIKAKVIPLFTEMHW